MKKRNDATTNKLERLVLIIRDRQNDPVSIRDLAKRLQMKHKDVLEACEDLDMCINVGFGIPGFGMAKYDNIGDYSVEDLGYDENKKQI